MYMSALRAQMHIELCHGATRVKLPVRFLIALCGDEADTAAPQLRQEFQELSGQFYNSE